jgi:signal peptidase I
MGRKPVVAGLGAVAATALAALAARRVLAVVEVVGESMVPTMVPGDRMLAVRGPRLARRGRCVIVRQSVPAPERTSLVVKRLVAMGGDAVPEGVRRFPGDGGGDRVPPGRVVLFGDGPRSTDSRQYGFVPAADMGGVVVGGVSGPRSTGPRAAPATPVRSVRPPPARR